MANLAIKGHATRGKEVIEILEMLGGKNPIKWNGNNQGLFHFVDVKGNINTINDTSKHLCKYDLYTLEGFLEEFPYKVGDKVLYKIYGIYSKIKSMLWNKEKEQVFYRLESNKLFVATADELKPYKGETMDKANKAVFDANAQCCDIMNHSIKEETMNRKYNVEEYLKVWEETENGLEVVVNDNFELKEDNGKFYIIKKQPQYPKTYEECCKILDWNHRDYDRVGYNSELLCKLQVLLLCRDAYWKIAGEQMGLGKPWKPDFTDFKEERYGLYTKHQTIVNVYGCGDENIILVFPTAEMRDAFYENFKDLIETCKELL